MPSGSSSPIFRIMDLLLFSGNSLIHKEWIEDVEATLKPLFSRTYIQYYKHWDEQAEVIMLDHELQEVSKVINEYEDYVIFGKSAGTLLALKGIHQGVLAPEKCVFVGLPVQWGKAHGFKVDDWIYKLTVPTLFIQKSKDPVLSYDDLDAYLDEQEVDQCQSVELPGDDHYYDDLGSLRELVEEFCFN